MPGPVASTTSRVDTALTVASSRAITPHSHTTHAWQRWSPAVFGEQTNVTVRDSPAAKAPT